MSKAIRSKEIVYAIHDGDDPGTYDDIAELADIGPPSGGTREEIEVTHHGSPGNAIETIGGMDDFGETSLTINWVPGDAEDLMLQALRASGAIRTHRLTWPNGYLWSVSGWIKSIQPSAPLKGHLTAVVTIRNTGSITMTSGS